MMTNADLIQRLRLADWRTVDESNILEEAASALAACERKEAALRNGSCRGVAAIPTHLIERILDDSALCPRCGTRSGELQRHKVCPNCESYEAGK